MSWIVEECVKWYFDKHVVKMILETAQLLSTAWWRTNGLYTEHVLSDIIYKPIRNYTHGCAVWVTQSRQNYEWLASLGIALCKEYTYRYGKKHKTEDMMYFLQKNVPANLPNIGITDVYQAMPDECKDKDPVKAYRNYYMHPNKEHLKCWKKRERPVWFQ